MSFFTLADNTRGIRGILGNYLNFGAHRATVFFSNRLINRWNQLNQRVVDASSINAFKGWLNKKGKQGWASSWTDPPSPRAPQWVFWLVRPHKASDKVSTCVKSYNLHAIDLSLTG